MQHDEARVALALGLLLGEGLHWDAARGRLWFVDIHGQRLLCWDLAMELPHTWNTSQRVGWVIPYAPGDDELLLGLQGGFARARLGGAVEPLAVDWVARPFEGQPAMRLNDAKADGAGAVWAGSLNNDDESRGDGRLFRLSADGVLTEHDGGYCVCNGPAIHPQGRWMLHTDSARRVIYRYALDAAAGQLGHRVPWKVFDESEGYPDGMTFDAEGCVWVAHWGGGCISRFAEDGRLLRRVRVPTSHATNVCFAGPMLDRLFVTTARHGLTEAQLASQPAAGALFEIDSLGVRGLPGRPYGRPTVGRAP